MQHRRRAAPVKEKAKASRASYEKDVILWSQEQARLLRAGRFDELDIKHLADEIEDVGKSEKRELANRMAVLLAHLLKWQVQPENRTNSWRATIKDQRRRIALAIKETPSLKAVMRNPDWQEGLVARCSKPHGRTWGPRTAMCLNPARGQWSWRRTRNFCRSE